MNRTPEAQATAAFLAELLGHAPAWLPQVDNWELFREDDGRYSLSGAITPGTRPVADLLRGAADANGGSYEEGRASFARFTLEGRDITLYHHAPPAHRPAPSCTTCGSSLTGPCVPLVWIGTVPQAICVPCRDRMHHDFLTANKPEALAVRKELTTHPHVR
ncbi:hypothetical protein [Streptomyces sp. NBC_01244]|uniref:hypothetical protein n=1 Tax=Streptomyces sp. NBC_01244 TaxID=2903797 RepID=UPI002E121A47|nr:hypothetical protein OG247_44120 [Streptomyces sp. NBC_01244]